MVVMVGPGVVSSDVATSLEYHALIQEGDFSACRVATTAERRLFTWWPHGRTYTDETFTRLPLGEKATCCIRRLLTAQHPTFFGF